jgi:hypothetical protein
MNGVKFIPPCSLKKFASLTCFARRGIKFFTKREENVYSNLNNY